MNEGTPEPAADTAEALIAETAAAFPSISGTGFPLEAEGGQPKEAEAVETPEGEETPPEPEGEPKTEEPKEAPEPEAPDKAKDAEPKPDETINFDGLSDDSKAFWENAVKEGWGTKEDVERARHESMFQSTFTKKTMALAEERKAFEAEQKAWREKHSESLEILERIQTNPQWNAAFHHLREHGVPRNVTENGEIEGEDPDDFVSRAEVERIAQERVEARERERDERTKKQQEEYNGKVQAIGKALHEFREEYGIDKETMQTYTTTLEGSLATDTDPVLYYTPSALRKELVHLHEKAQLQAELDKYKTAASQKARKDARTTKQSQPPPRQIENKPHRDGLAGIAHELAEELGIDPGGRNITGGGWTP